MGSFLKPEQLMNSLFIDSPDPFSYIVLAGQPFLESLFFLSLKSDGFKRTPINHLCIHLFRISFDIHSDQTALISADYILAPRLF